MPTGTVYSNGSLLKDFTIDALVNGREIDGIVMEGQAPYVLMKLIEESNAKYEGQGTGNKMLKDFEDRVAYDGDPTITAQVASVASVAGGIRINFSDVNYVGFRVNDNIDTIFGGNQAKVVESGAGYVIVAQRDGFTAPVTGDFPVGGSVIARYRTVDLRGTQAPTTVTTVPRFWKNHLSVIDDGGQQNLFDSLNQTNITDAKGYLMNQPFRQSVQRFFMYKYMNMLTSKNVNPETNGMAFSATAGWIEQIQEGGTYIPMTSVITKSEFEARLRTWFLTNPGNPMANKFVKTGTIGMALIAEWYKEQIKFDAPIAMSFTDGSINGLNATKVFIPGFEFINIVRDPMQDMNLNGELTSISGYAGVPKTAGDFWFMDMTPVVMRESGRTAPAIQQIYLGSKYYYAVEQGLRPTESLRDAMSGQSLTWENLEITSTTRDYTSFRIYGICGSNIMNRSAFAYLKNLV